MNEHNQKSQGLTPCSVLMLVCVVIGLLVGGCVYKLENNKARFGRVYDAIHPGQSSSQVLAIISEHGFENTSKTTTSITVFTAIGLIDNDLVMNIRLDEQGRVIDSSAFDTGFNIGYLF